MTNSRVFNKAYQLGLNIIEQSQDKDIVEKKENFKATYDKKQHNHLYSILHELKTYQFLKSCNLNPIPANDNKPGPDFECDLGYLECVVPTEGTGINEIDFRNMSAEINRFKAVLPRITSILKDKNIKIDNYLTNNHISPDNPVIIAIHPGKFLYEYHPELNIELLLKILYGCDDQYFDLSSKSDSNRRNYTYSNISYKNEVELDTDIFALSEYKNISAVLLVNGDLEKWYSNSILYLFINQNARKKLNLHKLDRLNIRYISQDSPEIYSWKPK